MAAEQLVRAFQFVEATVGVLVATVGEESPGGQQGLGAMKLVRVPPERGAGGGTAAAQDAFVQAVQLVPVLRGLQDLLFRHGVLAYQPGLHRLVLLVELAHVHHQVADDGTTREGPDLDRLLEVGDRGDAGQSIGAVDVHPVRAAHPFPAGMAERERLVLPLDLEQGVAQHHAALHLDLEGLHVGLAVGVGIESGNNKFHRHLPQYTRSFGGKVSTDRGLVCTGL